MQACANPPDVNVLEGFMNTKKMNEESKKALNGLLDKGYTLHEILSAIVELEKREQNATRDRADV